MSAAWEYLDYRDYRYGAHRVEVREADTAPDVHSELTVRMFDTATGRQLIRKSVERSHGQANRGLYTLLDREIRAGARLLRRFPDEVYPTELSRMVGYEIDGEEPYVLLEVYRGAPVAEHLGKLLTSQQHEFESGLLRALRLLEAAKLVHGGLGPDTVRWENGQTQVVGFEYTVLAGEPRVRNNRSRWSSPEQRAGDGAARYADDVWSAGAVVLEAVTGEDPGPNPVPERFSTALGELLNGVFAAEPQHRPSTKELLGRLQADDSVPARGDNSAQSFARSREQFNQVFADRLTGPDHLAVEPTPATSMSRTRVALLVATVLALVALVALGHALDVIG